MSHMPPRFAKIATAATLTCVLIALASCGSSETGETAATAFQKVTPSDTVYTPDDLDATGFKVSREYDVEGLTAATGAWFGWWRPEGSDPVDYEARLYASHDDAVEFGTPFAEEASGDDAVINSGDATWKEDVRDRRAIIGNLTSDGGGAGPKYGDFAIAGNMILLCEGATSEQSLERCAALIGALEAAGGS